MDEIEKQALIEVNESNASTFKVETNRANKNFQGNSMEVSRSRSLYFR